MATPYKIVLGAKDLGTFHQGGYNAASAAKVTEVLQHNLDNWDVIFSGRRHNHIVHDILTIYGLGASPEEIQKAYDREAAYQTPRFPIDENVVEAMKDKGKFKEYLGQHPQYSNFLLFFQREIEAKGVKATLEEHVFADTEHASQLLPRLFTSIFHGYIHLGFALEFNQPAIVAEALSMGCIHDSDSNRIVPIFTQSEQLAGGPRQPGEKTLRHIMEEMRGNETLRKSIDGPHLYDRSKNVADNAMQEMIKYAAQYSISGDQLEEKMDEMIDTCMLLIATKPTNINPGEPHKIDFYFLHCVNALVFMPTIVKNKWLSRDNAIRLIEWAGRIHLLAYVAEAAPLLTPAEVDEYPPIRPWSEIFDRAINHPFDDGHLVKCVRSLAFSEKTMSGKTGKADYLIKPGTWIRLANMVLDTVRYEAETSEQRWLLFF